MHEIELVLALLVAVAAVATLAQPLRVPYPILLVLAGLALAVIPGMPEVVLAPDLVFLLFLPPLLYVTAFNTSFRDIRAVREAIISLAFGLVLATTVAVAILARLLIPGIDWPAAFALGAIVSPPDAVAAAAVFQRLGVPRRLVSILEGESLFNDATALVVYQAAVGAAAVSFSAGGTGLRFLAVGAGGVLIGYLAGMAAVSLRRPLHDPPVEITVSLLTPFAAYLPAERLEVSGVLAAVTAGLMVGWRAPAIMDPDTRLRGRAVWDMVVFILNGLVFILIGLQLPTILEALSGRSPLTLLGLGLAVSLCAVLIRFLWVFGERLLRPRSTGPYAASEPLTTWQEATILGWAGMRGVVSLATALALPLTTPERNLLLFLTFSVILATLVGQGLSLPWLIRRLGITEETAEREQERSARAAATEAATERLERLARQWPGHAPLIDALRARYAHRAEHLEEAMAESEGDPGTAEQERLEHQEIFQSLIDAERATILELRQHGMITDEVWRRIERDLDLEELRMEA